MLNSALPKPNSMKPQLLFLTFFFLLGSLSQAVACVDPGSGVDTTSAAYQQVIANDPFCCTTQWDNICQNNYEDLLGPGDNFENCVTPPSSVDITSDAYAQVIANDPFCCNSSWDGICQNAYEDILGPGDNFENCVTPPSSVDITSDAYATVIANDPFCCTTSWDGICQSAYNNLSDPGDEGDDEDEEEAECVTPPSSVDVNSEAYQTVIANDPFCCNNAWDGICQNAYNNLTAPDEGDDEEEEEECVTPPFSVDTNSEAYQTVIANDPFCCTTSWDGICQNAYNNLVDPGEEEEEEEDGDCITPPANVDVNSEAYQQVIASDWYCCNIGWDSICQNAYTNLLGPGDNFENCVTPPASVDITSDAYATVIANDPFCCNAVWDGICQNAYNNQSGECSAVPPPSVDVNSEEYETVIANDPFCCNNTWDGICQNAYNNLIEGGMIENPGIPKTPVDDFTFSFFPNPSTGMIQLTFENMVQTEPTIIRITSMTGQNLMEKQINIDTPGALYPMDLSSLAAGMYVMSVQHNKQMQSTVLRLQ